MEEMGVIRDMYKANEALLGGTLTNQNTNQAKKKKWAEIAVAVNALGNSVRTSHDVKMKWKSMKAEANFYRVQQVSFQHWWWSASKGPERKHNADN